MANYSILKAAIAQVIKTNGNNEITGNLLQQQLFSMINTLGAGYQCMGVAVLTPTPTNPGTPDANVFYIASEPGTYANFGNIVINEGEVCLLTYNGTWSKRVTGAATASQLNQLGQKKVEKSAGKNLFDSISGGNIEGEYIYSDGSLIANALFNVSDYISIAESSDYHLSAADDERVIVGGDPVYIGFYDSTKTLLSTTLVVKDFSMPQNAAFLRFTYRADKLEIMLNAGTNRGEYEDYNPIGGYIVEKFEKLENDKVDKKIGKNLLDRNALGVENGKYIISDGRLFPNDVFDVSDYIPIIGGNNYHFSAESDTRPNDGGDAVYFGFYDSSKRLVSTLQTTKQFTAPNDASFVRVTYRASRVGLMLNAGTNRGEYEEYSIIGGYLPEGGKRSRIDIYKNDSESVILDKLLYAYNLGNCDVYFESGSYSFQSAYSTLYSGGMQPELPVGKNNRYFLNNSIITATPPSGLTSISVFGCQRHRNDFEIYDGTLICDGGNYCFHDETGGEAGYYKHIYKNLRMIYKTESTSWDYAKCLGCGLGEYGNIIIENCIFETDFESAVSPDIGVHAMENYQQTGRIHNDRISITGCYLSRGFRADYSVPEGHSIVVQFSNNSYAESLVKSNWTWFDFCNEIRQ